MVIHFLLYNDDFHTFTKESRRVSPQIFPDLVEEPDSFKSSIPASVMNYASPADTVPHRMPAQDGAHPIKRESDDQKLPDNDGVLPKEKGHIDARPSNDKKVSGNHDNISKDETAPTKMVSGHDPKLPADAITFENNRRATSNAETTAIDDQIPPINKSAYLISTSVSQDPTSTGEASSEDKYVAMRMAVKDQDLDLPEFFIHHYHHVGIRRFYIMDDGSDPPLSSITNYGVPNSVLTF